MSGNVKSKKVNSFGIVVLIITSALAMSIFMASPNAEAASPTQTYVHINWGGYDGNDTIYLTKGTYDQNTQGTVQYVASNATPATDYTTTGVLFGYDINDTNGVSLETGSNISVSGNQVYSFTQGYYPNDGQNMFIYVPIAISGVAETLNYSSPLSGAPNVSVWTFNFSANLTGLSDSNSNLNYSLMSDLNSGFNLTNLNGEQASQYGNPVGLDIGGIALTALAIVPGFEFLAIPGLAIGVVTVLSEMMASNAAPSSHFSSDSNTTPLYTRIGVDNGTYAQNPNYATRYGNYTNVWSFQTVLSIRINQNDFNQTGNLNLSAMNLLDYLPGYIAAGQPAYSGASSSLNIPIVPSNTITGTVKNNNAPSSEQEIVLTQSNLNNTVTQYFEKTDANGNYRFFAKPGLAYEIQAVTPSGLSAGNTVTVANDENNTTLNLNLNIPGTVVFSESGLTSGTSWYVATSDGQNVSGTSSTIDVSLPYSSPYTTYSYTIGGATGYYPSPESGSISVNDITMQQNVSFSPVGTVTFTESGLSTGTSWSVTLSNVGTKSSTSSSIVFQNVYYGSYTFTYNSVSGYTLINPSGSFTLGSNSLSESNTYYPVGTITFYESGLPSGVSWSVYLNGVTKTVSAGSSIVFSNEMYADYEFIVTPPSDYSASPQQGYVNLNSASASQSISFSKIPGYPVTFKESGLPSGTAWEVTLGGKTVTGGGTSISFSEPDGTYSYSVPDAYTTTYAYSPYPSSGSVTVNNGGVTVNVQFTVTSCVYALTSILMANGTYVYAENIHSGDQVMTYNVTSGQMQNGTVEVAFASNQTAMYTINGILKVAPDQKILTQNGYVEAQNLTSQDRIYNVYTQEWTKVRSVSVKLGQFTMYDFYIDVNHNFIAWSNVLEDKLP